MGHTRQDARDNKHQRNHDNTSCQNGSQYFISLWNNKMAAAEMPIAAHAEKAVCQIESRIITNQREKIIDTPRGRLFGK